MRGLERLMRWLGLGSRGPHNQSTNLQMDQSDKLLGHNCHHTPTRSRACLTPSKISLFFSLLLFSITFTLSVIMWCTDVYDQSILKLVSIRNDLDMIFDLWRFPPTRPYLSIYIFNYTDHKLPRVNEVGPYVFQERTEKINIQFHDNGTVSFQENKTIHFVPEKSIGSLNDTVFIPNIPIVTVINMFRNVDYMQQMTLSRIILPMLGSQPIQTVSVSDFVWGYEDKFYHITRKLESLLRGKEINKFGFLAKRRGVSHHVLNVNTGSYDLDRVANIEEFDGETRIGEWGDTPCDEIKGHEGGLFPGNLIYNKEPQNLYLHDMCRKLPLIYNKTMESEDGFPVNQYVFPDNMFDYSYSNSENQCYKYKGDYPPKGTFFSGACKQEAPIYSTLPHFLNADEKLIKSIHGLNPDPAKHSSSFLIHEKLGVTLRAQTKFQLNIRYNAAKFVNQFIDLVDGTLLPIAWLHYDSGPLPDYFKDIVFHLTYTTRTVQKILKWALLFSLMSSVLWMYLQIKRHHMFFKISWRY